MNFGGISGKSRIDYGGNTAGISIRAINIYTTTITTTISEHPYRTASDGVILKSGIRDGDYFPISSVI